jgi:hypothetical protein
MQGGAPLRFCARRADLSLPRAPAAPLLALTAHGRPPCACALTLLLRQAAQRGAATHTRLCASALAPPVAAQAHSFWGHSAALDLQHLQRLATAAAPSGGGGAEECSAPADSGGGGGECCEGGSAAGKDAATAALPEFNALQARTRRAYACRGTHAAGLTCARRENAGCARRLPPHRAAAVPRVALRRRAPERVRLRGAHTHT